MRAGTQEELMHHSCCASLLVLLAVVAAPGSSNGQLFSHSVTHSNTCPISAFKADADAVEKACCSGGTTCKPGKAPSTCTLNCAVVFVPFYDRCKATISKLFDGDDGREDGKSIGFDKLYTKCTDGKTVTLPQVFKRVKALAAEERKLVYLL